MKLKMRRLNSNDYYWAFTMSEILFLIFGMIARIYDQNYLAPAIFFLVLGVAFAIKAFDMDHPGKLTQNMGE